MAQDFVDGDVFYTENNGSFTPFKILKKRSFGPDNTVLNVRVYSELTKLPASQAEMAEVVTMCGVTPIDGKGFTGAVRLFNIPVTDEEMSNYLEYLMLSGQHQEYTHEKARSKGITTEALFQEAYAHYTAGNTALDNRNYEEAITEYTACTDLCPLLFEAYDNKGLAQLDAGDIDSARDTFNTSLEVNPDGELAKKKLLWIDRNRHA